MQDEAPTGALSALQPVAGDDRLGRYRLLGVLGRGGMAEVLLAKQDGPAGFQKTVVVKRILAEHSGDPRFIEMFQREARVAASLSHMNIVQVFELGDANGVPYIVMEYVRGLTLLRLARTLQRAGRPLPVEVVLTAIADAALGLHHAHSLTADDGTPLGLVHRDISPDNLIVNADGLAKILDFGIAKGTRGREGTSSGDTKGKIPYMSPEHVRGEVLDGRADLYALGVTLFFLLTGRRPFRGGSDFELMQQVVGAAPPRPSSIAVDVPAAVDELVMALLEKDRAKRPATGDDVHAALVPFLPPRRDVAPLIADALHGRIAETTLRVAAPRPTTEPAAIAAAIDDDDLAPAQPLTAALSKVWSQEHTTGGTSDTPRPAQIGARRHPLWAVASAGILAVAAAVTAIAFVVSGGRQAPVVPLLAQAPPSTDIASPPRTVEVPPPAIGGGDVAVAPSSPAPLPPLAARPSPAVTPSTGGVQPKQALAPVREGVATKGTSTVSVVAPPSVVWLAAGKQVGRGTTTLTVAPGLRQIVARDGARGVETEVPITGAPIRYHQLPRGTLDVRVFPNGRVYAGTDVLGDAPLKIDVVAGRYRLVVRGGGHERVENVVVTAGKTTPVRVRLE